MPSTGCRIATRSSWLLRQRHLQMSGLVGRAIGVPRLGYTQVFHYVGGKREWVDSVMRWHRRPEPLLETILMLAIYGLAALLTRIDVSLAGRAYAAHGGIYIVASLFWLWVVEGQMPDRWDWAGALLCLGGATLILIGQHASVSQ